MAWSFGHWLILIVALVAGLAAGWLLRGRRDVPAARPIVEGDPVAAVLDEPPPAATVGSGQPKATVDPAPVAAVDPAPTAGVLADEVRTDQGATDTDRRTTDLSGPEPTTDGRTTGDSAPVPAAEPAAPELSAPEPAAEPAAPQPAATEPATEPAAPERLAAPAATVAAQHRTVEEPAPAVDPTESATETVTSPVAAAPVAVPAQAAPAQAAGTQATDDFRRIQGVGPKMAAALHDAGIRTYAQLAELDEAALRDTVRAAGLRATASLATWPQQAKVLAAGSGAAALPTSADA
ncbi:Helix-hairpin-helix domain-containing protein [Micromonospora nigra]|uniref:Helix-hairpin-helix domain-containing protein n=1 Tax=Micromonospora nigra TaxID=145857 RepID=A0A1C6T0C5_9ACTN|nr:helix-hairpin-helix domain-containing protein [Micromonospora nigra]SCL35256.1 Helix-hairpin-helix domain-containing protein [Micromonospora nigra]